MNKKKKIRFAILNLGEYEETYHSELVLFHPKGFDSAKEAAISLRKHFGWFYKNDYLYTQKKFRKYNGFTRKYLRFEGFVHALIRGTFQDGDIDSEFNGHNCYVGEGWLSRGSLVLRETTKNDLILQILNTNMILDKINKRNILDLRCLDVCKGRLR